ncbi:MAG: MBL fold metallo-hydrolase [Melioribacteraceae bacterium]
MKTNIRLTVLYDNNPLINNLQTDWGFSCLLEFANTKLLFDTGDNGKILLNNMEKLGIDPKSIDIVFLSHFHHDHTGGLKDFLQMNSKVKVYFPQSFPQEIVDVIYNSGAEPVPVSGSIEIIPNIFSLGEIDGKIPEQSLALVSDKGLVVVTGCAHPGIITILEKAKTKFSHESIYMVIGGFHLHKTNANEINDVVHQLFKMDIVNLAPTHCSGREARIMFEEVFDKGYVEIGVGKVVEIY